MPVTFLAQEIPEIRGQLNKLVAFADNPDEQRSVRDHETTRYTRIQFLLDSALGECNPADPAMRRVPGPRLRPAYAGFPPNRSKALFFGTHNCGVPRLLMG